MKVLHYKSNFLNYSETFIKRLIEHHKQFDPVAMCYKKKSLLPLCSIFEAPKAGYRGFKNTCCFHLNWCLPFYTHTIQKVDPKIIHAHFGFDGYRMIKPSKKTGIPLVVSFHGSDVTRLPAEFDWKRRYRKLAAHGSAFTAVSNRMKKQLIDLGFPEQKIFVVRCGLDLQMFDFGDSFSLENPLMMVGRMVEKKGFIYALQAIRILKEQGQCYRLDIYGDGPLRNNLQKTARQWRIDDLVTFHGRQSIKKIKKEYKRSSLLLVPSVTASNGDQEGLPITLLEAMACGIPVIAASHSAIPEVITHKKTGLLVKEGDAKELVKMIQLVKAEQIDISMLRTNERKRIENDFEIDSMVNQIENIYREVIIN